MVFTSHIFLFYFLPAVLCCYYALPRWRNVQLLLASYVFYGWWEPWFILLMLFATAVNYGCGHVIAHAPDPGRRRTALTVSVVVSLGLLAFFKYFVFFQMNLNHALGAAGAQPFTVLEVLLPVGISFYIFQSMSYTIDLYRHDAPPARSFLDFACFVSLFPQLVAGPIVRYQTIAHQLVTREHPAGRFASGAVLFMLGFAKKILLANEVAPLADLAFEAESLGALEAWVGVTAYAFQIYFDFSAYSDMAIGLGRMFGFEFPINFNDPYKADSITDFWRRWHISLSTFLRDYLYIPLGGNRMGPLRTYVNLTAVMLLGGLWHGANWTFVVWGAYHGLLLAFERAFGLQRRGPRALRMPLTFVLVLFSWVLFRSPDFSTAIQYFGALLGLQAGAQATLLPALMYTPAHLFAFATCAVFAAVRPQALSFSSRVTPLRAFVAVLAFLFAIQVMWVQAFNPFLYFQF